jgi:hypothetical protein
MSHGELTGSRKPILSAPPTSLVVLIRLNYYDL